jgi:hypothetical protein
MTENNTVSVCKTHAGCSFTGFGHSGITSSEKIPVKDHWFWGNWSILALMAAASFALGNLFIGELAPLGVSGNYYYNSGSLVYTIGYFVRKACTKETVD